MIPDWVNEYIGLPYESHGRGPAYDCWGLVQKVYKEQLGIELPGYDCNYRNAEDRETVSLAINCGKQSWVKVDSPCEGDVVIINVGGRPAHCGVVVSAPHMLHARAGTESCLESYERPLWNRRIEGFYRHRSRCN